MKEEKTPDLASELSTSDSHPSMYPKLVANVYQLVRTRNYEQW